ncbi:MAG: radical SAM protein [Candidatus Hydrothermales bacterium]
MNYKDLEKSEKFKDGFLIKEFISSFCEKNCFYCALRKDRDFKREIVPPEKLAEKFHKMYKCGYASGLFLSSAILKDPEETQYLINKCAAILRKKYLYKGYIHLKIMPGADYEAIKEAVLYADRVSLNFEAPKEIHLKNISKDKNFKILFDTLIKIKRAYYELKEKYRKILPFGICTQFVYSPLKESDREYLEFTEFLYRKFRLSMVYFSRFIPVKGTPFENLSEVSPLREKRIYQANFLIRDYGFRLKDLVFDENGNLPLDKDPKVIYAEKNKHLFPIEIKKADYWLLLKVPGIGKKTAKNIITFRKMINLNNIAHFVKNLEKVSDYILIDGKRVKA